jgi:carbamoyl-phosphate synthase large subunit
MGFTVFTTGGTHEFLKQHSIDTVLLPKISQGTRPNILDKISNREIDLILNTATRKGAQTDEGRIRAMAVRNAVPMITTITGAKATVNSIAALRAGSWSVAAVQDYFPKLTRPAAAKTQLDVVVRDARSPATVT